MKSVCYLHSAEETYRDVLLSQ